jgi:hypothetical protein
MTKITFTRDDIEKIIRAHLQRINKSCEVVKYNDCMICGDVEVDVKIDGVEYEG